MKVLVTGGAGFIGSNLVDALINIGHKVTVIDNLSTGDKRNINPEACFYQMELNSKSIEDVFENTKPDIVFHLAAQVNVGKSIECPLLDEEINIRGTLNLLNCCKNFGVKKIVYSSSAAVYGKPHFNPITEDHITEPISYYGVSKLTPEYYIKVFSSLYNISYVILRYSNVFGPRQNHEGEGGVVSIFINKLINKDRPVIYGSGLQTRDFIFVKDVVNANLAAIEYEENDTFNIGTNESISVVGLLDLLSNIHGQNVQAMFETGRKGDIMHSCLDNNKAKSKLKWAPSHDFEQSLKDTLHYYIEMKWQSV
ncbi:NAD-dependent epimerase/dehydratase family protein [Paenibacillus sp. FSL R5-0810]|uniref:NAD-dependent epimerase/dehydratase family protein n=1 Tax=Paenibacillus sp. FSL R5-0810 TaxID=2921659 RepID=UPI0011A506EE